MAKKVKFNVKCMLSGVPVAAGQELTIEDNQYRQLSQMHRLGVPYVELMQDLTPTQVKAEPEESEADSEAEPEEKPKRGRPRKTSKETADLK